MKLTVENIRKYLSKKRAFEDTKLLRDCACFSKKISALYIRGLLLDIIKDTTQPETRRFLASKMCLGRCYAKHSTIPLDLKIFAVEKYNNDLLKLDVAARKQLAALSLVIYEKLIYSLES